MKCCQEKINSKRKYCQSICVLHHSQWVEKSDLVEWARRNLAADFRQEDMSTVLDVAKENRQSVPEGIEAKAFKWPGNKKYRDRFSGQEIWQEFEKFDSTSFVWIKKS